jgi:hypothetical protein
MFRYHAGLDSAQTSSLIIIISTHVYQLADLVTCRESDLNGWTKDESHDYRKQFSTIKVKLYPKPPTSNAPLDVRQKLQA